MEHNILNSMGKEGASNLVSLLSKSLEPVVDMHNNDCVICSCAWTRLGPMFVYKNYLTRNSNRILTESHPKMYKPFLKGLNNKQS